MSRRVQAPRKGQVIRASFLQKVADNMNEMLEYASQPRDLNGGDVNLDGADGRQGEPGTRGKRGPAGEPGAGLAIAETWVEQARSTSTVRVTSDSDDSVYVDVERIDRVLLKRPNGGRVTIVFDND